LQYVTPAVNGLNGGHLIWDNFGYTPEAPLVNLCALDVVGAEEGWVTVGKVLCNSN
jgi:hypothetical protein